MTGCAGAQVLSEAVQPKYISVSFTILWSCVLGDIKQLVKVQLLVHGACGCYRRGHKIPNNLSIIYHNFHACALKNKYEITLKGSELLCMHNCMCLVLNTFDYVGQTNETMDLCVSSSSKKNLLIHRLIGCGVSDVCWSQAVLPVLYVRHGYI